MFLLNKTSSYTMDKSESFCFLFPTELLFEGFVGGYMQEVVEEYGGKVKLQPSDIYLIDDIFKFDEITNKKIAKVFQEYSCIFR